MTRGAGSGGRIEVAGLGHAYPDRGPTLDGVSFEVAPGERLAVLGPNGAGKTTLLLHLNGLLAAERGVVRVDGLTVAPETLRAVRRRVGLAFQEPDDQLFLPTLLEDVAFGPLNDGVPPADAARAAREQLEVLGLAEAAGRAAHHLSGGEKRLAALATVLVSLPAVLVLDEPTAGLDAGARARLVGLLQERRESMVIATHDLEAAAALCDRAVVLSEGRVVAAGSVERILGDGELLRTLGLVAPLAGRRLSGSGGPVRYR